MYQCPNMEVIKVLVNGGIGVGKSSLLFSYSNKTFPEDYVPSVFDFHSQSVIIDGEHHQVSLWDTHGGDEYWTAPDRLRPLSYPQTDVFLVCFSLVDLNSFQRVSQDFVPEIKHYCPGIPFLLVGTKTDLRNDIWESKVPFENNKRPITTYMGEKLSKDVGAIKYVECSALTRDGVENVFDEALKVALEFKQKRQDEGNQERKCCMLL